MIKTFIERPVLSTVISVILVILGLIGLIELPITQYPDIAPPTVVVSAAYSGANADVVLTSVIVPLEEQINGVEGMTYMTSTAADDGSATITIYFALGTNPDIAAVNVQNRVSKAAPLLPAEVTQSGVTTQKQQSSDIMIFSLSSTNKSYDQTFLQNYANINLLPQIKRINGVGDASAFGSKDYSMRIWLKPSVMAAYHLIPDDINAALAEQNVDAAPGKVGENSNQSYQYTLKYKGRLKSVANFENIVIKSTSSGQTLLLKDVARIELGSLDYSGFTTTDGNPSVGIAISQVAGSNAHSLIQQCEATIAGASKSFPPGVKYTSLLNANDFLDESIAKVIHTLVEAFILVFIVVFVFLQDFRSTLIPAIAVPVAIIGTFFFLNLFGFTINLLTLFAMVLAIGIVVDDAIVVVEAVHAKLDQGAKSGKEASISAMRDISGAIVSITLVMAAVFIPVSFISGSSGVFYKQFGLTLAIAIIISAVNALTLSPALCALFLKPHPEGEHKNSSLIQRFYAAFNVGFESVTGKYKRSVHFLTGKKWLAGLIILIFAGIFYFLIKTTATGFVPNEDQGVLFANISLPVGSSLERSTVVAKQVEDIIKKLPEVESTLTITGQSFIAGSGGSYAMVVIKLKPWDKRTGKGEDINSVTGQLFGMTAGIKNAEVIFFAPPTLQGFGINSGFEFQLQDKTGGDINKFNDVSTKFLAELAKRKEIQYATTSFNTKFPQYMINVNVAKCHQAGVTVNSVLSTLQGYYGGVYASNFNEFGKQYRVMMQADANYRSNTASLNDIYVRSDSTSAMAPISEFVTLTKVYGPQSINRFNLYTSIDIQGAPNAGYSSGDAIKAINEVAAQTLPVGYGFEYAGITREEIAGGSQSIYIFILCLIFVYFLLSAQYESYILPFAVLLSLPVGLAGAFIFAKIFGVENNIYLQITLIMLIGLLAKNAILIVEFAVTRRRHGLTLIDAAIEGATARLRPILMTSFAFILGLLPLMLSTGAGAVGNKSIGTGAVGGMLIGTLFGVFVIPILFIVFQGLQERISGKPDVQPAEPIVN
ncbi:hydrophobic/amphiphilic exporter-1, HAE1 family [Mucilaginibacter mallensis]|uniref:Hydrophobic/amphiphilic exporter-1, HAE1 family n=1 Tax=Mucilaginibacter mallensis TaxID=652787 RepID=A0A1H1Q9T0_MUCMA|nr:efflux RND transporter permease subunit [Mucilaginibacter mallensis]SDS20281.1 hydrophobic/amphiphilic exporter-1, HAE1 family [Mucilaginibacter mallensis]